MNENYPKNIKKFCEFAFNEAIQGNTKPIKDYKLTLSQLKEENHNLYEIFLNEFSYEWNKHIKNLLFKKNTFFDINIPIIKNQADWIFSWQEQAKKSVEKITDYNFETLSFEKIENAVEKLSKILLFTKNEKNIESLYFKKHNLIDTINWKNHNGKIPQNIFRKNIITLVYFSSILKTFNEKLTSETQIKIMEDIFKLIYDEKNQANSTLFLTTGYKLKNDEEIKEIKEIKINTLTEFTKKNIGSWQFISSLCNKETLLTALSNTFNISSYNKPHILNISEQIYNTNQKLLLETNIPQKKETLIIKKAKI